MTNELKVGDSMAPLRECVGPNDTVAAAQTILDSSALPSIAVTDHCRAAGIVGNAQIALMKAEGRSTNLVRIREIMQEQVAFVAPGDDEVEVQQRMADGGITTMPVLETGKLKGVLYLSHPTGLETQRRSEPTT